MTNATKLDWRFTPEAINHPLISLEQMLDVTGLDEFELRPYLDARGDFPVATYKGEDLWLVDTLHDLLVDRHEALRGASLIPQSI